MSATRHWDIINGNCVALGCLALQTLAKVLGCNDLYTMIVREKGWKSPDLGVGPGFWGKCAKKPLFSGFSGILGKSGNSMYTRSILAPGNSQYNLVIRRPAQLILPHFGGFSPFLGISRNPGFRRRRDVIYL